MPERCRLFRGGHVGVVSTMLTVSLLLAASLVGCSKAVAKSADPTTAAHNSEPTTAALTAESTTTAGSIEPIAVPPDETGAIRQVIMAYWEAFNAYDVEKVLSHMEDSWRNEHGEALKRDIAQMKMFRVKLGVEEESPPVITGKGEAEMMIKLNTPIGIKHDYFRLVKVGEEWKISFSEER